MSPSNCKHESHQSRDAAASRLPRHGLPCITHGAETIPFNPFRLPISRFGFPFPLSIFEQEIPSREQRTSADPRPASQRRSAD